MNYTYLQRTAGVPSLRHYVVDFRQTAADCRRIVFRALCPPSSLPGALHPLWVDQPAPYFPDHHALCCLLRACIQKQKEFVRYVPKSLDTIFSDGHHIPSFLIAKALDLYNQYLCSDLVTSSYGLAKTL